jgi:N-acetylglucosamine malate deacetylase 1
LFNLHAATSRLIVAAHPDDDIIGCGGSLAKYPTANTTIVYMTSGDAGGTSQSKAELSKIREEEAKKAAAVLGVTDLVFLRNPDGFLECNKTNCMAIANLIREKKPDILYTHSPTDMHPDHLATFEITRRATIAAATKGFQEITGSPWASDAFLAFEIMVPFERPQLIEDITPYMELKLKALQQHESQRKLRCQEWIEGLNKYRAGVSGMGQYAEAFKVLMLQSPRENI